MSDVRRFLDLIELGMHDIPRTGTIGNPLVCVIGALP